MTHSGVAHAPDSADTVGMGGATDLFGEAPADIPVYASASPSGRRERERPRVTPARLVAAALGSSVLAYLFDMPFASSVLGLPFPPGTVFVLGCVALQIARPRRGLQQALRPPVAALFFAVGLPLLLTPFAFGVRYVFYLVIVGSVVALYEWTIPD